MPLEIAVHDVLTGALVELGAPLLQAHLAKVDVPAARCTLVVGKGCGRPAIHIAGGGAPHAPDLSDQLHLVLVRQARVVST